MSVAEAGAPVVLELTEYGTLTTGALTAAHIARLRSDFSHAVRVGPIWEPGHTVLTAEDHVGFTIIREPNGCLRSALHFR